MGVSLLRQYAQSCVLCKRTEAAGGATILCPSGGETTDGGLQQLDGLQQLTTVELHSTRLVTDVGVRALASHARLTSLSFSFCDLITGEAFRALHVLPALRYTHTIAAAGHRVWVTKRLLTGNRTP